MSHRQDTLDKGAQTSQDETKVPNKSRRRQDTPYVGPQTFRFEDREKFFGRDHEAQDLRSLVLSSRCLLFYAQSGAGKSSLINTRLTPTLQEKHNFEVLPVGRVVGADVVETDVANIYVYNLLRSLSKQTLTPQDFGGKTLSEFLNFLVAREQAFVYDESFEYPPDFEVKPRVLIIDQFEELLTTHPQAWEQREDFFRQLGQALEDDELLWIVLTMREDYVARLDPYAYLIPNGLRERYFMKRMGDEAALDAVKMPVRGNGWRFEAKAAEALVNNLRQIHAPKGQGESQTAVLGESVEPVQLQVVCLQLWRELQTKSKTDKVITTDDLVELALGRDNNVAALSDDQKQQLVADYVDGALARFYSQEVKKVTEDRAGRREFDIRRWFEEELITTNGTRNLIAENVDNAQVGRLPTEMVEKLQDRFLVRAENRAGNRWFELVHDRFIDPILQSNQRWRASHPLIQAAREWDQAGRPAAKLYDGKQLADAEQHPDAGIDLIADFLKAGRDAVDDREQERKIAEQKRRSQYQSLGIFLIFIVAVGAGLGWWLADVRGEEAEKAQEKAVAAQKEAERQEKIAKANRLAAIASANLDANPDRVDTALLYNVEALQILHDAGITFGEEKAREVYESVFKTILQGPRLASISEQSNDLVFSPDGHLISANMDGTISIWKVEDEYPYIGTKPVREISAHEKRVQTIVFDHTRKYLLSLGTNANNIGEVKIWDFLTGEIVATLTHTDLQQAEVNSITSLGFTRSGLIALDREGKLWQIPQAQELDRSNWQPVDMEAGSSDSSIIASPETSSFVIKLLEGTKFQHLDQNNKWTTIPIPNEAITTVALSPKGNRLAAAHHRNMISLYPIPRPESVPALSSPITLTHAAYGGHILALAFSPERDILASADDEGAIVFWDIKSRKMIGFPFWGHNLDIAGDANTQERRIRSLAINETGTILASAGEDGTVVLWKLGDPHEYFGLVDRYVDLMERTETSLATGGYDVGFMPQNETVDEDQRRIKWRSDWETNGQVQNLACRMAGRNLTRIEWLRGFREADYELTCEKVNDGFPYGPHATVIDDRKRTIVELAHRCELERANEARTKFEDDYNQEVISNEELKELILTSAETAIILEVPKLEKKCRQAIESLNLSFDEELPPERVMGRLLALADRARDEGDISLALEHYNRIIDTYPKFPEQEIIDRYATICFYESSESCDRLRDVVPAIKPDAPAVGNEAGTDLLAAWAFQTNPGQLYRITINTPSDTAETVLDVRNASGYWVGEDYGVGNHSLVVNPSGNEGDLHFVTVRPLFNVTTYTLSLEALAVEAITPGDRKQANFEDDTVWEIEGVPEQFVAVRINANNEQTAPKVELRSPAGYAVASDENYDGDTVARLPAVFLNESEIYQIIVDADNDVGNYEISVDTFSPTAIEAGDSGTGDLEAKRLWLYTGEADEFITIEVDSADEYIPTVSLYDQFGFVAADQNHQALPRSVLRGIPTAQTGTYSILVGGDEDQGAYSVTVMTSTVTPLEGTEPQRGRLEENIVWQFNGQPGQPISLAVIGESGLNPQVTLYAPSYLTTFSTEDFDFDDQVAINNHMLTEEGPYSVVVGGIRPSGTYTVSLIEPKTKNLIFGRPERGNFDDLPVWQVRGGAGQVISLTMTADGPLSGGTLSFFSPSGEWLNAGYNEADGQSLTIRDQVLFEAGTYNIIMEGVGNSDSYTLTLTEVDIDPKDYYGLETRALAVVSQQDYTAALAGYEQIAKDDIKRLIEENPEEPHYYNLSCWFGSLLQHADEVLPHCERAVAIAEEQGSPLIANFRDSRGVALALTGDFEGAIRDFEAFVNYLTESGFYDRYGPKREAWIEALKNSENPFTREVLDELRNE